MFDRDRDLHELTCVEIEQSARLLIAEYGVEAEASAEMRVTEMLMEIIPTGGPLGAEIPESIYRRTFPTRL